MHKVLLAIETADKVVNIADKAVNVLDKGMDVADKIVKTPRDLSDKPKTAQRMAKVTIEEE